MLPACPGLTNSVRLSPAKASTGAVYFFKGAKGLRVKKVINNNILCVIDERNQELIVTGKGLGFRRHPGEFVDPERVEKVYRMESRDKQRKLRELVEQIPIEHLELTEELIADIKRRISSPLNESLLITLADHISFAIRRKQEGVTFQNPLQGDIMCYYPTEYRLGQYCVSVVRERTGIELSDSEASFIALHIVNAELNTDMSEMYDITRLIEGALQVVEYYYRRTFDRESLDFNRFVVHLRYFAQRLFHSGALEDGGAAQDAQFREMIIKSCAPHYKCAQHIAVYVKNTWHRELSDDEMIYLTIHLKRINAGRKDD